MKDNEFTFWLKGYFQGIENNKKFDPKQVLEDIKKQLLLVQQSDNTSFSKPLPWIKPSYIPNSTRPDIYPSSEPFPENPYKVTC